MTAVVASCALALTLAAAPPDSFLRDLSRLGLKRVRVTADRHALVLVRPRFEAAGIAWRSVEGFPRPRPAVIAGADWDSVAPPANPVAWEGIERLEWPRPGGRRTGVITGGAVAFVLVGLPLIGLAGAYHAGYPNSDAGAVFPVIGAIALGATLAGAAIGHATIPRAVVWEEIALPASARRTGDVPPALESDR